MERYPVRENYNSNKRSHETPVSQDKNLELKLAPPGENKPLISLHYMSPESHRNVKNKNLTSSGTKREFLDMIIEEKNQDRNSWLTSISEEYQSELEQKAYATPANYSGANVGLPTSSKR